MFRAATGLVLVAILVSTGCLGAMTGQEEIIEPADESSIPEDGMNDEQVNLTRTLETLELTWSEVRAWARVGPSAGIIDGDNCIIFEAEGNVLVENGNVTATWTRADHRTSPYTVLRVQTSDLSHRVDHRLGPTHEGEPYTVDIDGWNLSTDHPVDYMISFIRPEEIYAGTEHHAEVTVEIEHTGELSGPHMGRCG